MESISLDVDITGNSLTPLGSFQRLQNILKSVPVDYSSLLFFYFTGHAFFSFPLVDNIAVFRQEGFWSLLNWLHGHVSGVLAG